MLILPSNYIYEVMVSPKNKLDRAALHHDIAYGVAGNSKREKSMADRHMVWKIDRIPYGKTTWMTLITRGIINTKQRLGLGTCNKEKWQEALADELHTHARRHLPRRRVVVGGIDDTWCADLVEMQELKKWNRGVRFLLMVLDIFRKYGWAVLFENKSGRSVGDAFVKIPKTSGWRP